MVTNVPESQRALILQGGGALGAYEAGVIEGLSEELLQENTGRPLFDIIAGTSSGAINAALLVSYYRDKKTWNGVAKKLTNFWRDGSLDLGSKMDFWIRWWHEEHKDEPSAASYEAARRYYSAKYLLQNGASRVFSKPKIILDEKFFDTGSTFPNNIWFRSDKSLLRESIEKLGFPIATSYEKGEPRLLVVSTNVKDGSTVTFDSYPTKPEARDYSDSPKEYTKHTARLGGGIELADLMASASIPLFYEFEEIDGKQYCDGGVLSNTPLREVLQAHRDYWFKDVGGSQLDSKVPDLEVFIVGVWPTKADANDDLSNFDEAKARLYDINLSDKTVYDEKVAVLVSDYIEIIKRLTEISLSKMKTKEQKDSFEKEIKSFYKEFAQTSGRDGKKKKYGSLLHGRARIASVTRIECKADRNTISNKAFDVTRPTVENLIAQGKKDADEILSDHH